MRKKLTYKNTVISDKPVRYLDLGRGETIVVLHAAGDTPIDLKEIIYELSKKYRVIVPNLFDLFENQGGYTKIAKNLNILLKKLKIKETLVVGISLGGAVSLTYAACYPKKVKQIVAADPGGIAVKMPFFQLFRAFALMHIKVVKLPGKRKYLKHLFTWDFLKEFARQPNRVIKTILLARAEDLTGVLPQINTSVNILWGEDSDLLPKEHAYKMQKLLPNCKLTFLPRRNHLWFRLEPEILINQIPKANFSKSRKRSTQKTTSMKTFNKRAEDFFV